MMKEIADREKIKIYTGVQADEILEPKKGVRLADGKTLPADLVIISAGIRPSTALAMESELPLTAQLLSMTRWRPMSGTYMHAETAPSIRG